MSADITNPREHVFTWVPLHQEVFSALKSHGTFPYGNPTTDCSDQGFRPLSLGGQLTYFPLIQSTYIHLFLSPASFEVLYWTFDRQLRDSRTKVKWWGKRSDVLEEWDKMRHISCKIFCQQRVGGRRILATTNWCSQHLGAKLGFSSWSRAISCSILECLNWYLIFGFQTL